MLSQSNRIARGGGSLEAIHFFDRVRPEGVAGFQLWVNLPAKDKMTAPEYRDIAPADVPVFETEDGVSVRVIAGSARGGAVVSISPAQAVESQRR